MVQSSVGRGHGKLFPLTALIFPSSALWEHGKPFPLQYLFDFPSGTWLEHGKQAI